MQRGGGGEINPLSYGGYKKNWGGGGGGGAQ